MNMDTYLKIAEMLAEESKATKLKVGCVVVRDGNFLSFSYNGTPPGTDNTCEDEHNKTYPEVIHAESMAITKAAKSGVVIDKATMCITHAPCIDCAKLIYQAGIQQVWFRHPYKSTDGVDFLLNQGIDVRYLPSWNKGASSALKDTSWITK